MAGFPTAGAWPVSAFDPSGTPAPQLPPVILADAIGDDLNGRDYTSLTKSGDPLDQHVRHTFAVLRNTGASARDHGHRFKELKHMDELTQSIAEGIAREALQHLIDPGWLSLESVTLNTNVDEGLVHIAYKNRIKNQRVELDVL